MDVSTLIVENELSSKQITLDQLPGMELFTKVTVTVKAIEVNDAVQLSEKMKQDIAIADRSATSKVTLWEEHVGALEQGKNYILKKFVVRVYQSTKYLGMGGDATKIVLTDHVKPLKISSR